jgi:chromatin structure-remodeling complex subunit RSC9
LAFQVKTVYYKYLSYVNTSFFGRMFADYRRAYEISTVHKQEPPPKEILEELTAKGGDLLNRTLENYHRRAVPEVERLANGNNSDESDDDHGTPKGDKMDVDDPPSTGGRVTRGMLSLFKRCEF